MTTSKKQPISKTQEIETKLNKYTSEFRSLDAHSFDTDWKKGELLLNAQLDTKELDAKGKCWSRWVTQDLGVALRTGQRYRDVYEFFGTGAPTRVNSEYLRCLGMTKLDLLRQIHCTAGSKLLQVNITESAIFVSHMENGEEIDALEYSVGGLRKALSPSVAKMQGNPSKRRRNKVGRELEKAQAEALAWKAKFESAAKELAELKKSVVSQQSVAFETRDEREAA